MKFRKGIPLLITFCMLLSWTTCFASAVEPEAGAVAPISVTHINPLYAEVITEADLVTQADVPVPLSGTIEYFTSVDEAGAYLREGMEARLPAVIVYYQTDTYTQDIGKALFSSFMDAALQHTGVPTEGDYIRWHYAGYQGNLSGSSSDGIYYLTYTFTFTYNSTSEQEDEMNTAVANLLSSLDLSGSSYDKLSAVYDWICKNVTYDYENLGDDTYKLKHTAYAALINRTAVCQGYAALLYRLALEMDIDCRLISGLGNGGNHGWNIVKLGSVCYNVDATWDAGRSSYRYYLKCPDNFPDHVRDTEYETAAFHAAYPMSQTDYDPITTPAEIASGTCGENLTWSLDSEGTLTISGTGKMDDFTYGGGPWNDEREEIISVVIETGVTSIGNFAFANCTNMTDVLIGNNVIRIGEAAFCDCSSLTEVDIPSIVDSFGICVFDGCSNLTGIWVDEGNVNYSSDQSGVLYTNENTNLLKIPEGIQGEYSIPSGVTVISDYAVGGCKKLVRISIPDGVLSIGQYAFHGCSNLTNVTIPDSVTDLGGRTFESCDSLTNVVIGNSVTTIDGAFAGCSSLTSLTIPDSVISIGNEAFCYCSSLTEITFNGNAPSIGTGVFNGVTATAYYPAGNATWTEAVMQDYGGTITWMTASENLPGDINGDGKVNNRDAARLMQYLAGWDVECVTAAMDVNGDGKINNRDAARLMQYLAGWDVTIN